MRLTKLLLVLVASPLLTACASSPNAGTAASPQVPPSQLQIEGAVPPAQQVWAVVDWQPGHHDMVWLPGPPAAPPAREIIWMDGHWTAPDQSWRWQSSEAP